MDQYYINENLYLFLNDESNKSDNNIKKCDFKVAFDKPIILNKQMECALVKLCSPTYLYNFTQLINLKFTLKIHFTGTEDTDEYGLLISPNPSYPLEVIKDFYLNIKSINDEDIIKSLNNIEDEMNIFIKQTWNKTFPRSSIYISPENPKEVKGSVELAWSGYLEYHPLEIINSNKEITLDPARVIINTIKFPGSREIALTGMIEISKSTHKVLGLPEDKFPLVEFIPGSVNPPPEPAPFNVWRNFITTKGKFPMNINTKMVKNIPDIIYIYCDIVSESYVSNQKVNILQLYVLENSSKKELETISFKNLIYIPLRIDEINSITIQMRDKQGQILYYDNGNINVVLQIRPIEHI